jgi:hypothetical protein
MKDNKNKNDKQSKQNLKKKRIPGPKPSILKIEGSWEEAVKKSLKKKRPSKGWQR